MAAAAAAAATGAAAAAETGTRLQRWNCWLRRTQICASMSTWWKRAWCVPGALNARGTGQGVFVICRVGKQAPSVGVVGAGPDVPIAGCARAVRQIGAAQYYPDITKIQSCNSCNSVPQHRRLLAPRNCSPRCCLHGRRREKMCSVALGYCWAREPASLRPPHHSIPMCS